jgi:hypothetical protein
MLVTEWNWDTALRVRGEEEREEGREEGQSMVLELVKQGYTAEQIEAKLAQKSFYTQPSPPHSEPPGKNHA